MSLDVLKLIVSLLQVLVWPAVVLIALRWFRAPITTLIRRLKSFKGPAGVAGEFAEEATEIVEELKSTASPGEQARLTELVRVVDMTVAAYEDARRTADVLREEHAYLREQLRHQAEELMRARDQLSEARLVERASRAGYEAGLKADIGDPADSDD